MSLSALSKLLFEYAVHTHEEKKVLQIGRATPTALTEKKPKKTSLVFVIGLIETVNIDRTEPPIPTEQSL